MTQPSHAKVDSVVHAFHAMLSDAVTLTCSTAIEGDGRNKKDADDGSFPEVSLILVSTARRSRRSCSTYQQQFRLLYVESAIVPPSQSWGSHP